MPELTLEEKIHNAKVSEICKIHKTVFIRYIKLNQIKDRRLLKKYYKPFFNKETPYPVLEKNYNIPIPLFIIHLRKFIKKHF